MPPRLALFTDTLGDINGVSRFLTTLAAHANDHALDLRIFTSTRFPVPSLPTITNLTPRFSAPIPRYPQLHFAIPPLAALTAAADAFQPTHVHVSTPGPVGLIGRAYALKRKLPLAGTYHTDFPAYIDRLFEHESLTTLTSAAMRWFYTPFNTIFSRSTDYATRLESLGIPSERLTRLRPGIDLELFNARRKPPSPGSAGEGARCFERADEGVFVSAPLSTKCTYLNPLQRPKSRLNLLYVGRLSVEKNLPFLTDLWPATCASLRAANIHATLIITGEGPYEPAMRAALTPHNTRFTGVLRGTALADLYRASDLFLFPSTTDTLGQAVMEAQACGLPCLISPIGGPGEIVLRNRTALMLPITHAAWHNAILRLASDTDLRAAMSQAAATHGATFPFAASATHFWNAHTSVA